jgi:hypothetical protein
MGNTIKELSAGDITRKALSILHNNLVFVKTINREYDDRFARSGAKNGGTLLIREPNQFTIRSGAIMDTQDVTETTQTLTVATQRGVDINFSSVELTLSLDDFAERILKPAMSRLAAEVDKTVISGCYPWVNKHENTTFGTKPNSTDILAARAMLQQGLAPTTDRILMCGALEANAIITSSATYMNPASEISRQYETGLIGNIYGFKFYESEMTPTHTCGTRTTTTPLCATTATATSIESGTAYITMTGAASNVTFTPGDVFTVEGVYDCNPETKTTSSWLKQWVVTTGITMTADATDVAVSPTPYRSGAKQNCVVVTGTVAAVIYANVFVSSSGTAGVSYINSLAYHKDAFTFVSADLEMPKGVDFASRQVFDGISMRIVRNYDVVNDKFPCRIDVLFGYKTIRPDWAVRICS